MATLTIPTTPNAPGAWSPYDHAPAYVPPRKYDSESIFFARQLERIRPRFYEVEFGKIEAMRLLPPPGVPPIVPPMTKHTGVSYAPVTGFAKLVSPLRYGPQPRPRPPREIEPVTERRFPSGRIEVYGTLDQVKTYFEARGYEIVQDRQPMRDATPYRLKAQRSPRGAVRRLLARRDARTVRAGRPGPWRRVTPILGDIVRLADSRDRRLNAPVAIAPVIRYTDYYGALRMLRRRGV